MKPAKPVTAAALWEQLTQEGLQPEQWSNAPGAVYRVHEHPYQKVLYVVDGSITVILARSGLGHARRAGKSTERQIVMRPGDRLELPAQTPHRAVVGPNGVVCLEAHRSPHPTS